MLDSLLMSGNNIQIVLERRVGRKVMGCLTIGIIIGFLVCLKVAPEMSMGGLIFFGILFAMVLLSKRHDYGGKRNIILSTQGIRFSEGVTFYKPATIPWNELGEVKHLKKVSIDRTNHGTIESVYNILELKKTGILEHAKPSVIHYCNDFGRQVLNSTTTFTAERAVELIEKLRDAGSEKARIQILKDNNKGKNPEEVKKRLKNVPWKHRLVRYCPTCKVIFVVDGRKEQSEQRCHSCGSNEIYEDEDEYLKTLDKGA
ncbi:MAG TPA: hypothetical protein EYQ23_08480 [Verrucomicrobiales bacterium]|nr:hypothetical protein [Verrucomicrobiales bacterium]